MPRLNTRRTPTTEPNLGLTTVSGNLRPHSGANNRPKSRSLVLFGRLAGARRSVIERCADAQIRVMTRVLRVSRGPLSATKVQVRGPLGESSSLSPGALGVAWPEGRSVLWPGPALVAPPEAFSGPARQPLQDSPEEAVADELRGDVLLDGEAIGERQDHGDNIVNAEIP
jgi:hypothetical protein